MFGIGFGELVIILLVLLIAVGPDRMPTFMKAVGKGLREFRRASESFGARSASTSSCATTTSGTRSR